MNGTTIRTAAMMAAETFTDDQRARAYAGIAGAEAVIAKAKSHAHDLTDWGLIEDYRQSIRKIEQLIALDSVAVAANRRGRR